LNTKYGNDDPPSTERAPAQQPASLALDAADAWPGLQLRRAAPTRVGAKLSARLRDLLARVACRRMTKRVQHDIVGMM
jgi:hypothetical protein